MRSALKLGAKVPSVESPELRPHWQVPGMCRSILLESLAASSRLITVSMWGVGVVEGDVRVVLLAMGG